MRIVYVAALAGLLMPAQVWAAASSPSVCRGLDEPGCAAKAECRWVPERIAGVTLTLKSEPAKTSAKAHCRKGPSTTAPQASH